MRQQTEQKKKTRKKRQPVSSPAVAVSRKKKASPLPREYNREFTPEDGDEGHTFKVKRIPTAFWNQVSKKAQEEGISLRGMVLRHLREWVTEEKAGKS